MLNLLGILFIIIPGGIIGLILFGLLNKYFDVYYFGVGGMLATLVSCLGLGVALVGVTLEVGGSLISLIIQWAVVIWIVKWIASKLSSKKKTEE